MIFKYMSKNKKIRFKSMNKKLRYQLKYFKNKNFDEYIN